MLLINDYIPINIEYIYSIFKFLLQYTCKMYSMYRDVLRNKMIIFTDLIIKIVVKLSLIL